MAAPTGDTSANAGSQITAAEVSLYRQYVFLLRQLADQYHTTPDIPG
ncbi:hypothetical protein JD793_001813 [Citrobacter braakii]|nr:hypothetical protein [Citrobacter braakii]